MCVFFPNKPKRRARTSVLNMGTFKIQRTLGQNSEKSSIFPEGVGKMTTFDREGGRGEVKISENLTTWYMDAP